MSNNIKHGVGASWSGEGVPNTGITSYYYQMKGLLEPMSQGSRRSYQMTNTMYMPMQELPLSVQHMGKHNESI